VAATAATKADEGFASDYEREGRFARPTNRIEKGVMGEEVIYWIQWSDHPVGNTTFRCVVNYGPGKESLVSDQTVDYTDSRKEGWSICGIDTVLGESPDGTYHFAQYLQGDLVGEASIEVKTRWIDRIKMVSWKVWAALLALIVAALVWHDKRRRER
jgi:hypothetical protein